MKVVIYPSFQMIRYGNCVWVEIFDVSQIKVKMEKTEGGALRLGKVVDSLLNNLQKSCFENIYLQCFPGRK